MTKSLLGAVLALAIVASEASADTGEWRISGFGTLGMVRPTEGDASLLRNGINTSGRDGVDFGADSVIGLQAGRSLASGIDVTAQMVVREDQNGNVEPRLAWAFVRFTPLADLEFRIGRMRAPFFMFSESLWINYANTWVRPPTEVYGLNPFSDLDGADMMWHSRIGGYDLELRPYIGRSSLERRVRRATLKRIVGMNLSVYRDDYSFFLAHAESPFSLPWSDPIFIAVDAALRASPFFAAASDLSGSDGYARFDSIGMQWDNGEYLASAEYARRAVNRYIPSAHGWQLTLGRRVGTFTAYGVLARQTEDEPASSADLSSVPPLQSALDLFNATRNTAQKSATVGARWDFHRNAALKLEFTHAKVADDSLGSFFPVDGSGTILFSGRRINLFSASVDVSF
ncbi:MAG: hypothetical protein KDH17_12380 [Rhodocyclaceae bacterium]|nr:hypothetical protein [Rhodocyclaceae bacterium]